MHSQFKKFSFFGSNEQEVDLNKKPVKYLYRYETDEQKIKSGGHHSKRPEERRHKSSRKKSEESLRKRHRKNDFIASEPEICLISPDVKKHRRQRQEVSDKDKQRKSRDGKHLENEAKIKRRSHRKEPEAPKINVKKYTDNKVVPKNVTPGTSFFKKFFVFKPDWTHRYSDGNSNAIFFPFKTIVIDPVQKVHKHEHHTTHNDTPVPREAKKHRKNKAKESQTDKIDPKPKKKRKSSKLSHQNLVDKSVEAIRSEFKPLRNSQDSNDTNGKTKSKKRSPIVQIVPPNLDVKVKKSGHKNNETESVSVSQHKACMTNIVRTNPDRHKFCLAKNTFYVVEIAPKETVTGLESKKKAKSFKSYYKYDNESDTHSNPNQAFSDSHKNYLELSESSSTADTKRRPKKNKTKEAKLQMETHVSDSIGTTAVKTKDRTQAKKSKIPVLHASRINQSSKLCKNEDDIAGRGAKSRVLGAKESESGVVKTRPAKPSSVPRNKERQDVKERKAAQKKNVSRKASTTVAKRADVKKSSVGVQKTSDNQKTHATAKVRPNPTKKLESVSPASSARRRSHSSGVSYDTPNKKRSRSIRSAVPSKSDTNLHRSNKHEAGKNDNILDGEFAKTSLSNSTFQSAATSKNAPSFFLTKTYVDEDTLSRQERRRAFSETVRRQLIDKYHRTTGAHQVLEVRYLTISNSNSNNEMKAIEDAPEEQYEQPPKTIFFQNDLPPPCIEMVEHDKFHQLFNSPTEESLNEILNENYNFLQKDFSFVLPTGDKSVNFDDISLNNKDDDWYEFCIPGRHSLSEISCCEKPVQQQELIIESDDHIVDSVSAPGSEESGYSTIKSANASKSFFERPDIKALINPSFDTNHDSYCFEVQIETKSSSHCGLEICSIESKSLQTSFECCQKSVQINLSLEETLENIDLSEGVPSAEQLRQVEDDIKDLFFEIIPKHLVCETVFVEEIGADKKRKKNKIYKWLSDLSCIKHATSE